MTDWKVWIQILIIAGFLVIIVLRALGPTKNKAAIDRSIEYLKANVKAPAVPYAPDPALYEKFKDNCTDPVYLKLLAMGILRHCGMFPLDLTVRTKTDRELKYAAGTYSSDGQTSVITIRITPSSRYNIIHSVLIHECMHYFLSHSGLRFKETYANEILTDTATVYMGFFDLMYDGYLMVGYLRDSELKYIHNKLLSEEQA